jgi:hypothetical protein
MMIATHLRDQGFLAEERADMADRGTKRIDRPGASGEGRARRF